MRNINLTRNPYLLFSPFLILFIVIVLKFHSDVMEGDEGGYILLAQNLLNGFYSPPAPDINLWWGPGYPILLTPFLVLRLPLFCITVMNAVFLYLSIVILFKAMLQFVEFKTALIFSLFWGFCYSSYAYLASILTEIFVIFLITLLIFSLVKVFVNRINKYLYLAGFILGYLALTKVMFGYVLPILLSGSLLLWINNRKIYNYRFSVLILIFAFITVSPYLIYTYNLTGRIYYWGNSGGMSLYWMSTPYENEYGSWDNEYFTANYLDKDITGATELLKLNHQNDLDEVLKYKGVQKDDAYKKLAVINIKNHPEKYIKNIFANISNLFFGFPNTYTYQRPILKIWYFSIVFTLMLFSFIPTIIHWRSVSYCIRFLLVLVFIYLGGSSLVSGGNRQFIIIVPVLLLWFAYIFNKTITLKIKFDKST